MIQFTPDEQVAWKSVITKIIGHEVDSWDPPGPGITDSALRLGVRSFLQQRAIAHIETQLEKELGDE